MPFGRDALSELTYALASNKLHKLHCESLSSFAGSIHRTHLSRFCVVRLGCVTAVLLDHSKREQDPVDGRRLKEKSCEPGTLKQAIRIAQLKCDELQIALKASERPVFL